MQLFFSKFMLGVKKVPKDSYLTIIKTMLLITEVGI